MERRMLERMAPLSGVAALVLLIASALTLNFWKYLPTAEELQEYYTGNSGRIMAGAYLGILAAFSLVWFAGSILQRVRQAEGGTGRLASLAYGGTVIAGAMFGAGYAVVISAAARGGDTLGIGGDAAIVMNELYGTLIAAAATVGFAVVLVATGLACLRNGLLAPWVGWLSIVLAVGSLTPVSYIFLVLDLVWVAALGLWMFAEDGRPGR